MKQGAADKAENLAKKPGKHKGHTCECGSTPEQRGVDAVRPSKEGTLTLGGL
jgi:hypothetical protein